MTTITQLSRNLRYYARSMSKGPADTHLARAIYNWRAANGYNQAEAARRLGISYRSLQDYERGVTERPHPMNLNRLAAVMGTTTDELLAGPRGEEHREKIDEQIAKAIADTERRLLAEIRRLREQLDGNNPRRSTRAAKQPSHRSKS